MLVLMNTTKTMDPQAPRPAGLRGTAPAFGGRAADLADALRPRSAAQLARLMGLSASLAESTRASFARFGADGNARTPALCMFTGLVYKHLDAASLDAAAWRRAQDGMRIISGLYGVLRPRDLIEPYRLEMGVRWTPDGGRDLAAWWRDDVTASLARDLKGRRAALNLASQEYMKAVDEKALPAPVISPVFKERRADGTLKTAPVHAKMARGAMARFALENGVREPADLLAFAASGWEPESEPPASGAWLFTRPARD